MPHGSARGGARARLPRPDPPGDQVELNPDAQLHQDVLSLLVEDPVRRINRDHAVERILALILERLPVRAAAATEYPRLSHADFARIMSLHESELRSLLRHRMDRLPRTIIGWLHRCCALTSPLAVHALVDTQPTTLNRAATGVTEHPDGNRITTVGAGLPYIASNGAYGEITAARIPAEVPEDAAQLLHDAFGAARSTRAALAAGPAISVPIVADASEPPRPTKNKGRRRAYGDNRDLMLDALQADVPFVARCFLGRGDKPHVPRHFYLDISPKLTDPRFGRTIRPLGRVRIDAGITDRLLARDHPELEKDAVDLECLDSDDRLVVFRQSVHIQKGQTDLPVNVCLFEGIETPNTWALTNLTPDESTPEVGQTLAAAMHTMANRDACAATKACRDRNTRFRDLLELTFNDPDQHARYLGILESAYAIVAIDRVYGAPVRVR